ncbi:peptide-methionine (S)-S-oxide reductase MsrA [Flagellimonas alvinocaridis]|uniref:Peptide methionine sulfoxide reductase MsrA n=1 Tax=Flagellimonas alvinocaridis TaxID=2530200 RepID=A0A4V4HXA1_9FLAO|nr:peptide-methionine (S)-S-oxide reductase MsrA [Allomuricauda alvinocaridis]THV60286.1 peptide-methionine (S)-S-oxide reductase MsrA [Allomuricauda alvinocaridis]
MKTIQISFLTLLLFTSISCQSKTKNNKQEMGQKEQKETLKQMAPSNEELQKYETAYFASGCFWCVEAIFESVKGVKEVYSGYSGGKKKNPTYEQVGYGRTDHAEAVEVYYDPNVISFPQLVQVFFGSHDPTTLNRQGPDRGAQYRSIAFYKDDTQKKTIEDYIAKLEAANVFGKPIVTQVKPFEKFYMAEEYHQDYEKKHPNNPYIQQVSIPRLNKFKAKFGSYLKEDTH